MDIYKFLGSVESVSEKRIVININTELSDWDEATDELKVGDPVNVIITKPQMTDWQKWLKKFNSIFTR